MVDSGPNLSSRHMVFVPLSVFRIPPHPMGCSQVPRLPKRPRKRRKNMIMISLIRRTLGHSCLVEGLKLPWDEKQVFRRCSQHRDNKR